jgi:hypothetical protein
MSQPTYTPTLLIRLMKYLKLDSGNALLLTDKKGVLNLRIDKGMRYSSTGNTGAVTNAINYTPPAVAGMYRLSAMVNVTAWTTPASFTLLATYKDASGGSASITLATFEGDGTNSAAIDEVENFFAVPIPFQIDNSATAITLSTSGTFTGSPVYNLAAALENVN